MAGSVISGKVTSTVTLGSASYPSPLTVTTAGDVTVAAYGSIGIYGPVNGGTLINDGTVTGGVGSAAGTGGIGVDLLSGSTATNRGFIAGGSGGSGAENGGNGGIGVYLAAGAALTNLSTITGGSGGVGSGGPLSYPGGGGAGVVVNGGSLTNSGTIAGGYARGAFGESGSSTGVSLLAGTLTNTGTIIGGGVNYSNGSGGDGVYLAASATLLNSNGTIIGGHGAHGGAGIFVAAGGTLTITGVVIGGRRVVFGGGVGVDLADGGSLDNTGTVIGGAGVGGTGVYLAKGGTLTNDATIIGGAGVTSRYNAQAPGGSGVSLANGGAVINNGFISGGAATETGIDAAGGDGVDLTGSGTLTNNANATITGGAGGYGGAAEYGGGAGVKLVSSTLTNAGTIIGGTGAGTMSSRSAGFGGTGVTLTDNAIVINSGSIAGGVGGSNYFGGHGGAGVVMGSSSSGSTLVNSGLITGGIGDDVAPGGTNVLFSGMLRGGTGVVAAGDGADVGSGDTLINNATIAGSAGVYVGAGGAFINNGGTIIGGVGAVVASGGTLINTGAVSGGVGVYLAAGSTLTTSGTISGGVYAGVTADAVLFAAAGTLALAQGASFIGQVVGSAASIDALYLSNYGVGTLSGIGTQFVNFSQITVGSDASWTLTGADTIASGTVLTELSGAFLTDTGTLVNDGSIVLDPSTMTVTGLIGSGLVNVGAGSTLEVQGTVAGGETIMFGGGSYLRFDSPGSATGSVTNFAVGDTIFLSGVDSSTVHYSPTSGQLTFGGGDIPLALANGATVVALPNGSGTDVTAIAEMLCFCANTLMLTPSGERPVQDLVVGDLVTTHRGQVRPIVWIGTGKVLATRGRRDAATPVIIRKGALADNVPSRDLRVTKGHAFWFGGALIPVEFLVNHRLIEWDDRAQEVSLYHIELATHDVLVANGAAAESYRDDGNRWLFQNANLGWDLPALVPCAPVLTGGPFVDAVWRRLLERAGSRPGFALTDDPDLHLLVDDARVDARGRPGTACVFQLPARPVAVRIVSRAGVPEELGLARDPRVLGVAVRRIVLRRGTQFRVIEAADCGMAEGFHPFEPADGMRWTDGDAVLEQALFEGFDGAMELVLHVGGAMRYPLFGAAGAQAAAA